ncbi:IS200/IS605 family transposase, partial [Salmonella enterica subsp. enterica serovar Reading]|nr:IS200/IS605 family transposase [Salmonella enterica subsp. enterica serovar Reading]
MGRWWRYKWITFHPSLTAVKHNESIPEREAQK